LYRSADNFSYRFNVTKYDYFNLETSKYILCLHLSQEFENSYFFVMFKRIVSANISYWNQLKIIASKNEARFIKRDYATVIINYAVRIHKNFDVRLISYVYVLRGKLLIPKQYFPGFNRQV
jgi:hypothetical protein